MNYMIGIFITLISTLFLLNKYYEKKTLKIILKILIALTILYCIVLLVDMSRTNSLKKPIFALKSEKQSDAIFEKTIYKGLGYRIEIETKENSQIISTTMYMFEKVIAATTTDRVNDKKSVSISKDIIDKLSAATEIIIKTNSDNDAILGTISEIKVIEEIIEILSAGKQSGDIFDCDGPGIKLEMYEDHKLIDTIFVWILPRERIMPASIHKGCAYYYISSSNSLTSIIEKETGLKFYNIFDYTEDCVQTEELVYQDDNYKYYFSCIKSDKMFIEFVTTGLKITIKEALNNNYITINELLDTHPDLFIIKTN